MNRAELERQALELIKNDMQQIGTPEAEIMEEIKTASDYDLKQFVELC